MKKIGKDTKVLLEEIGLSDKEITLYLCALSIETFTIGSIALLTHIKRPTCYVIIESLIEKGLISSSPGIKKKRYQAELPAAFANSLKMKAGMLDELSKEFESMRELNPSSKVRFFNNKMGLEQIYKSILDEKPKVVEAFFQPDRLEKIMGSKWAEVWGNLRREKGIAVCNLLPKGKANKPGYDVSKKHMREIYELPAGIDPKVAITIFGDNVGFLCDSKELMSFLIKSKEFADTMRGIFSGLKMISKKRVE